MKTSLVKPFFLLGLSTLFFYTSSAQLTITSSGNVGVGVDNPVSKFAINDSGNSKITMYVRNTSATEVGPVGLRATVTVPAPATTSNAFTAIQGLLTSGNGGAKGIFGQSYNSSAQSSGKAYGVYGSAGNATSGYNYGLYGLLLGSNNGAAIYGVTGTSDLEENTGGVFAGYFKGRVYISDYLSIGNRNTTYPVDVTGTLRATTLLQSSDSCLKENICNLDESSISTLKQIRGVNYTLKRPEASQNNKVLKQAGDTAEVTSENLSIDSEIYNKRHNGFIAQEIQKVYPDLVYTDNEGMLSIDYLGFIPIIVEALKEQGTTITSQASEIKELKEILEANGNQSSSAIASNAILYQNSPNPFSTSTMISCFIPENSKSAAVYIFNMQGTLITKKNLNSTGNTSITINGSELKAGMYLYSLIVDNKEVDSKRMILTE